MRKQIKFDVGAAVRAIARDSVSIPTNRVVPSKKFKPVKHKKRDANES